MAETHVLSALRGKYAELMGQLRVLERDTERLRVDLDHVECTMRLFDADVELPTGKRPRKANRWSVQGNGTRSALEVLRDADRPLTAHEITLEAMRRAQMPTDDGIVVKAVASSLRGSLKRRLGRGVVVVDGFPTRWALSSTD